MGEELVLLGCYLRRALDMWTDNAGDKIALSEVRKLAAIAVRCMENHEPPRREDEERQAFLEQFEQ